MTRPIIYKPKGRAGEYAEYAANLHIGCPHGCLYCYGPASSRMSREEFHSGMRSAPNAIERFEADCRRLAEREGPKMIFLSFLTDPCHADALPTTERAIGIAHSYGHSVNILTKAGGDLRPVLKRMASQDVFGITLTCSAAVHAIAWESNAARSQERIKSLQDAHALGIQTRVSFEPVLFPQETFDLVRLVRPIADLIQVGRLNVHAGAHPAVSGRERSIDWPWFAREVRDLLERLGGDYMLKHDLRKYLEGSD